MAPPEFLFSATICCYSSLDLEKILILGRGEQTFICIEEKFCCAANDTPLPVGMVKEDGFICKLGLYCCTAGLKKPDMKNLISGVSHVLCFKSVAQFPFGDKGAFAPPLISLRHNCSFEGLCTRPPCVRSRQAGVRHLRLLHPAGDGLHEAPARRWRPPRGHRDGPLSSLTAHRRAEVPTTMVFFLKDVTRTPCASACEGRVGKDLVTLLRLDAHAAARRYDMPCSPEPAPGACVCRQTPRQRCTCI